MHIISHVRVRKWSKSLKCNKETMRNTDWRADTDFRVNKDCFLSPDGGARVLSAHIRRHSSPDVWPSSHNSLSRFKTVLSCKVSIGLWSLLPLLSLAKKEINPGRAAEASGCWLTPRSPSCSDDVRQAVSFSRPAEKRERQPAVMWPFNSPCPHYSQ